ncbi:MAG TPA: hypothetical protein VK498_11285, partial [Ferruginibacter sp.]|nr:hypothetical protein [Ferruginibacter sp.]
IESQPSVPYAPYFGLDIKSIREWFETQFENDMKWENFGEQWQFEHIIPVIYFDFSIKNELKLCWNFTNLRVEAVSQNKNRGHKVDVLAAKAYFKKLHDETGYTPCLMLLQKINEIELFEIINSEKQFSFIKKYRDFLELVENYSEFEFGLLNKGRSIEDVNREAQALKKIYGAS